MMAYELFYLIGASRQDDVDKIKKEVEKIVTEKGGQFTEKETLEKRRLSYAVKHETHGIYIARRFDLEDKDKLQEITNKLNLNADVLRFVLSRASDLPELKSKEERISEAAQKESADRIKKEEADDKQKKEEAEPKTEEKEPAEEKPEKKEAEKTEESTKVDDENIDKKLEEILNI